MSSYQPSSIDLQVLLSPSQGNKSSSPLKSSSPIPYSPLRGTQMMGSPLTKTKAEDPANRFNSAVERENISLKGAVIENEQVLETTYEVQIEGSRSAQELLQLRINTGQKTLKDFDEKYRWAMPSSHTKQTLIEQNSLQFSQEALRLLLRQIKKFNKGSDEMTEEVSSPTPMKGANDCLKSPIPGETDSCGTSEGGISSMEATIGTANYQLPAGLTAAPAKAITQMSELFQTKLGKERLQCINANLRSTCLALMGNDADYATMLTQLHTMLHTDVLQYIRERLASLEVPYTAALDAYGRIRSERDAAKEAQDLTLTDIKCNELLDAAEKCCQLAWDFVNNCTMNSSNEGNFRSSYEKLRDDLRRRLHRRREVTVEAHNQIRHDMPILAAKKVSIDEDNVRAMAAYKEQQGKSVEALEGIAREQSLLWDQATTIMEKMQELGKTRVQIVNAHIEMTEKEYKRIRHYDELCEVLKRHTEHLTSAEDVCNAAKELLNGIDDYTERAFLTVEQARGDESARDLAEIRAKSLRRFHDMYVKFVTSAAERCATFTNRQSLSQRNLIVFDMQCETCGVTLDPNRQVYKEKRMEIEQTRQAANKALHGVLTREAAMDVFWSEVERDLKSESGGDTILNMNKIREDIIEANTKELQGALMDTALEESKEVTAANETMEEEKVNLQKCARNSEERRKGKVLKVVDPDKSPYAPKKIVRKIEKAVISPQSTIRMLQSSSRSNSPLEGETKADH